MKRDEIDRDVRKELEHHLEERTRELIDEGMPPAAARAEAKRVFGDRRRIDLECRQITRGMKRQKGLMNILESLLQDLRYGCRSLMKAPGFTTVALLTLALGIGANTAIFSVINGVLLRPLPYPEPERLVSIWERGLGGNDNHIAWPNFADWQASSSSFESMAVHPSFAFGGGTTVIGGDTAMRLFVASVSQDFFRTMGVSPVVGRPLLPEDHVLDAEGVAIVSHGFWQTQLGATQQLAERPLTIGSDRYEVVGVMPPGFRFPAATDVWIATERFGVNDSRTAHNHAVVARLRDGVSIEAAADEVDGITAALKEQFGDDMNAVGANVRSLHEELIGDTREPLYMLLLAAGLVLLVACSNLASTLLARGSSRRHEIAVRSAVGAGRGRLVVQMLTESLLLAVGGSIVGLGLTVAVLRGLVSLGPSLPGTEPIGIDLAVLSFTGATAVLTALAFGLFPALLGARTDPGQALRSGARGSSMGPRAIVWKALVSAEVALALILLVGAGLLMQSFTAMMTEDAGFDPRGVLTVDISVPSANHPGDEGLIRYYDRMLSRVAAIPGVESAGVVNLLPLGGRTINGGFLIEGRDDVQPSAHYRAVSDDYFAAMGIPILRGRTFGPADRAGAPGVVIVNSSFARAYFGEDDPLGHRIGRLSNDSWVYGDEWLTIVGIVGDVRHAGLTEAARPEIYVNGRQRPMRLRGSVLALRTSGDPNDLIGPVRAALDQIDRDIPTTFATMSRIMGNSEAEQRFLLVVMGTFAVVALTLCSIGIYGVVSYSVAERHREMGIRIALGAAPAKVRAMVTRKAMGTVLVGIALGAAGSVFLGRTLEAALYEVGPLDPFVFATVIAILAAAAWAASFIPALRGSRVDPIVTMQAD